MDTGFSQRKDMLLNALIERKGLQYLTNTAAQALDNPIFLYDMSGKILAMSDVSGHDSPENENGCRRIAQLQEHRVRLHF